MPQQEETQKEEIRYYKGKQKCKVLTQSHRRSAIEFLEDGPYGRKGLKNITITRNCWRKKKNVR